MIIVEQIRLSAGHSEEDLRKKLCKKLAIKDAGKCPDFEIVKRAIDARKKPDIFLVYTLRLTDPCFLLPPKADKRYVKVVETKSYDFYSQVNELYGAKSKVNVKSGAKRPVIAGFGPAGMFCALFLARAGLKPIVLERGKSVEERSRDVESFFAGGALDKNSNVQFGEGGAGTFSDGKLNTGTGQRGGRSAEVLKTFASHGAPREILFDNKPHIGTDVLVNVVKSIREEIIGLGGEVNFNACLSDIITENGNVRACIYKSTQTGVENELEADALCLAIGHSARDTFTMLNEKNIPMQSKAFAVGLRIEHPQALIDKNMYGEDFKAYREAYGLPAADYKLTAHTKEGRGVYSFCMCPGGFVVNSSSEEKMISVNGMSYHARDGVNANSALIVTVTDKDFGEGVLDGVEFQRKLERAAFEAGQGKVPVQLLGDFTEKKVSTGLGNVKPCIKGEYAFADLRSAMPDFISESVIECMEHFDKKIPGFFMPDACLSGIESRTSSPIRIIRGEKLMSETKGLFPCGEGAGYAGGIMSSAVDGIKCAEAIMGFVGAN